MHGHRISDITEYLEYVIRNLNEQKKVYKKDKTYDIMLNNYDFLSDKILERREHMLKKICVAYEGSDNSNRAFEFALEMCRICPGAAFELTVLSVVVPPEQSEVIPNIAEIIASIKARYETLHKGLLGKAKERNLEIKTEICEGDAAQEILKYVDKNKCDMVFVGQRGKSVIDRFILGSVSRRVVRYANCAVTVVK